MTSAVPTLTRTEAPVEVTVPDTTNGDHDKFAHIVPKSKVADSYVFGTPIVALCGKEWVPSQDPEKYPVCKTCQEVLADILANEGE